MINPNFWPDRISSSHLIGIIIFSIFIRLNQVWYLDSIYLTWFDYFESDFLPFTFRVEDGERFSQSNSGEYYFLGQYPTLNTRGRYIPIYPVVIISPTLYCPVCRFYLNLSWYHIIHLLREGYYNIYMFRCSAHATSVQITLAYKHQEMEKRFYI